MPTGILSIGTIATRLRAAADSSTLSKKTIEELAACAQTLEAGWPSAKQWGAIAKYVGFLSNEKPELGLARVSSSIDYWYTEASRPEPKGKPEWMLHNEEVAHAAYVASTSPRGDLAQTSVAAICEVMRVLLDEVEAGEASSIDDLDAMMRVLKRLA